MIIPKPIKLAVLLLSLPILTLTPSDDKRSILGLGTEIGIEWVGDIFGDVTVGGTILPSPHYLADDLQYFPPDESFKLNPSDPSFGPDDSTQGESSQGDSTQGDNKPD